MRSNRLRSLLTAFGIIIGVAAVIILVALGNGVKAGFDERFSRLANQITIMKLTGAVPGGGEARDLTDSDVDALRDPTRAPHVATVTPTTTGNAVVYYNQRQDRAKVIGSTADYPDIVDRHPVAGTWFTPAQERTRAKVAVLGQDAVANLWGPGTQMGKVLGADIRVGRVSFKVIGVMEKDRQQDNAIMMPMGTARAYLLGSGNIVNQIIIKAPDATTVPATTDEVTRILDEHHHIREANLRDFNIRAPQKFLEQRGQFLTFLTLFVAAIAAISLIVGGIGVANIMLVVVTERTREIGIRKAIGAPRGAILRQFLIEAIVLTGLGGLVGVVVGVSVAYAGGLLLPQLVPQFPPPVITASPMVIAFMVSLIIGLMAGGYPANRAARLRPIEALRFE
ncbi:ABC transporter permease [Pseudonocardia acaciae]|uniref:ABC transporter permease n=1 Tax=Pseudonocardia acaciae TaxID=551276 RepID=UPI0014705A16|nr:ABC transporter permease [Pseudonocardia acaciae]